MKDIYYKDYGKLNQLSKLIAKNIEEIYKYFDVSYTINDKMLISPCFSHGGDNKTALNFYHHADYKLHFICRTHDCQNHFQPTAIGLVRGALSHAKYGWSKLGDEMASFNETIMFLLDKFKLRWNDIKPESIKYDNTNYEFCKVVDALQTPQATGKYCKEDYRNSVDIPSPYYLQRGYSIEVLDDYDVGTCKKPHKYLYNRAVVPIYDNFGEKIVGFSGRSIFDECKKCNGWHDPDKKCFYFPKWKHTKGFERDKSLYNYHNALPYINKSNTLILVESPGNVWRLEEAGIHNSVAIFGTSLSTIQKQLIDETGAFSIIIIMDNDKNKAGEIAAQKIKKQCEARIG